MLAALILAGTVLAQDEAAPPPGAGEAALQVEFQQAVDRFLALEDMSEAELVDFIAVLDDLAKRSNGQPDVLLIKALCHARLARLILDQRRALDKEYDDLKEQQRRDKTDELSRELADMAGPRLELAERVAEEYANVNDVLTLALERADAIRESPEANLIRGVVLTQAAIVNGRVLEAATAAAEAGVPVVQVPARQMRSLLDQAQELLSDYLKPENTPRENGLEWIRGQFYLGVVEYRRSLVDRVAGEDYFSVVEKSRTAMFNRAREVFLGLADSDEVLAVLHGPEPPEEGGQTVAREAFARSGFNARGYTIEMVASFYAASANLYLGLIASVDPVLDPRDPQGRLDAATIFLERAAKLDGDPSLTGDMIPISVLRVKRSLQEVIDAPEVRKPLNDLTLSFGMTTIFDSNVILLGRSSEPPIHKSRKRDFRVGALFKMNYVMDLDALTPKNEGGPLSKWQMLFELRTAPIWDARIHDFNEQYYGGTLNLRYELAGADEIANVDGLFLHARYDYDYIMLGNDGFLRVNRIRPSFEIVAFDQVLDTTIYFAYEDRNYLEQLRDERFDRDGNYFSWGVDTLLDLGKWVDAERLWGKDRVWGRAAPLEGDRDYRRPMEVMLGFDFTTNSTQGDQFDYSSQILTAGVKVPLPYGVDFSTNALFEWQDYRGNSLVDHRRRGRKDFVQEYQFRLQRKFYLTGDYDPSDYAFTRPLKLSRLVMTLSGDIRIIIDDSNVKDRLGQHVFEYNRFIYGAGVRFDID